MWKGGESWQFPLQLQDQKITIDDQDLSNCTGVLRQEVEQLRNQTQLRYAIRRRNAQLEVGCGIENFISWCSPPPMPLAFRKMFLPLIVSCHQDGQLGMKEERWELHPSWHVASNIFPWHCHDGCIDMGPQLIPLKGLCLECVIKTKKSASFCNIAQEMFHLLLDVLWCTPRWIKK